MIHDFLSAIKPYNIDYIYPAMDGVLFKLSQFAHLFEGKIVAPEFDTARITRSKKLTYQLLKNDITVPNVYDHISDIRSYPVFIKPDVGQGSYGAQIIENEIVLKNTKLDGMILMEYLPGEEYTVDCFTNNSGNLIYTSPRYRKRIKNGISVSSISVSGHEFKEMAEIINKRLKQKGGWFFQVKRNVEGKLVLLEVASRIAGTSAFTRSKGINLPLLTLYLYADQSIEYVNENAYDVIIDRALYNSYATNLQYDTVYIDYDDTIVFQKKLNCTVISFLYQCVNNNIPIILITRHQGDISLELQKYRLSGLFDEIIHLGDNEYKYGHIDKKNSIFIDDSFGERELVRKHCQIPVFDTSMAEFLLNSINIDKT
jgi:hypothetical protein